MSNDPGAKPELGWLPVARCSIDARYQRQIDGRRSQRMIALIADKFNWSAFQAIVVTDALGGWLIIDGQHRVEAAKLRNFTHVPAIIVKALTPQQQAEIFVAANKNRVGMTSCALYHAAVMAGDQDALAVQKLCTAAGITIPRYPVMAARLKAGETLAIGALGNMIDEHGEGVALLATSVINTEWGNHQGALSASVLRAVAAVIGAADKPEDCALQIGLLLRNRTPAEFHELILETRKTSEMSWQGTAQTVIHRLIGDRVLIRTRVPGLDAPPRIQKPDAPGPKWTIEEPVTIKQRVAAVRRTEGHVVTPSSMDNMERLKLMVRQGAPITRIMDAFKVSKTEALKMIADHT